MPRIKNNSKGIQINMVDHNNGYYDAYYNRLTFGEPRQKIFAVLRYEKHGTSDDPGWYIKEITSDQQRLKQIAKHAIDFPASDGQGWVSNVNDIMIVEIIPTDSVIKNI